MTRPLVHRRQVLIDGVSVRVRWADYLPPSGTDDGTAVVVIPGWSLAVTSRSCWPLYQAFACHSGRLAIAMDARADRIGDDSLYQQAEALGHILRERGLTRLILAGHSQGGAIAANLAAYLAEQASAPTVEGLLLLDPVGLFRQGRTRLAVAFLVDALVNTPFTLLRYRAPTADQLRTAGRSLRIAADLLGGLGADFLLTGDIRAYGRRFASEVACLAQRSRHLADVRCPVVVVQGIADRVSDPRGLAPDRSKASRDVARRFPAASRFCYRVCTTLGLHSLPLLRPEAVARGTLAALRHR